MALAIASCSDFGHCRQPLRASARPFGTRTSLVDSSALSGYFFGLPRVVIIYSSQLVSYSGASLGVGEYLVIFSNVKELGLPRCYDDFKFAVKLPKFRGVFVV